MSNKIRIVVWCGSAANQRALVNKIAKEFDVVGIVIDERPGKRASERKWTQLPALVWDRFRFRNVYSAWKNMMGHYNEKYPSWPDAKMIRVQGINSPEAEQFTKEMKPDLVVVSGTALVKGSMLKVPASIGIINLHTGLSPYVKGGPNCTNWCIANNTWHLVGNTIMWLNAGIDAGNIITTESIDIRDASDLTSAHIRVMEHAHDLYIRAIRYLAAGKQPYTSVPQSELGKGELFLNKMWGADQNKKLLKNWNRRRQAAHTSPVKTIPLP